MTVGIDITKVTVRGRATYVCATCAKAGSGDTVEVPLCDVSRDDLARAVRDIGNHAMPVGWAGYGTSMCKCPDCAT